MNTGLCWDFNLWHPSYPFQQIKNNINKDMDNKKHLMYCPNELVFWSPPKITIIFLITDAEWPAIAGGSVVVVTYAQLLYWIL